MSKILDLEHEYVNKTNWLVRENANVSESAITLFWYVAKHYILQDALKYLPSEAVKAHKEGWLHINKLLDGAFYLPYCGGFDTARILEKGLITPSVISKPPKHLDSAVDQLANFIMVACQERTGAVGLNAIDLYLAPFVKYDKLDYKQVKQCVQRFVFNLNYTTRVGYQTPFSNVTFGIGVKDYYELPAYVGGKIVGKLGDFINEAKIVLKAFLEVLLEGDAFGRPFSVAGDEVTIVRLNGEVMIDYIGKIIDSLFDKFKEHVIRVGDREILPLINLGISLEVLGISPKKIPTWQSVLFISRHLESKLLEIKTEGGFSVKVTKSHSILVWDKNEIITKKAEEVKLGDELVILRTLPCLKGEVQSLNIAEIIKKTEIADRVYVIRRDGKRIKLIDVDTSKLSEDDKLWINDSEYKIPAIVKLDTDLGYLTGIIIADGYFSKNFSRKKGDYELSIGFNLKKEKELADRVANIIEKIFGVKVHIRERKDVNLAELIIESKLLAFLFRELIWSETGRKIPEIMLFAPYNVKIGILAGLIDGNGTLCSGEKSSCNWRRSCVIIHATDKKLAYSIMYLLASMSIPFELVRVEKAKKFTEKPYYHICIPLSQIPEFCIEVSWKLQKKRELVIERMRFVKGGGKPYLKAFTYVDGGDYLVRLKVKDVRPLDYNGYVYDFTTASETFLANMIFVHNTFPIPTVIISDELLKILNEDIELSELFWRAVAERGALYFLNNYAIDASGIFSFCCRLTANVRKVIEYLHMTKGVWVLPPSTGSIGYVTINLPRIAIEAIKKGDEKYVDEILYQLMTYARQVLMFLRRRYNKLHRLGYYPLTKIYVDEFDPFKYYYNTIAVTGMAEYVAIILNEPNLWIREIDLDGHEYAKDIIKVYRKTFEYMNKILKEFEEEDRVLYNLEQAPAESSSYRFAKLDWERYPEFRQFIPHGKDPYTGNEEVYYTSQNTPPYTTYRLETQLLIESEVQQLFTGGVMKHIFVHKPIEPEYVEKLMIKIAKETKIVYYSYAPTQSICLDCGYRTTALIWECPKCGSTNVEQWSRIVGYYRPVRNWNPGRRAAFTLRKGI